MVNQICKICLIQELNFLILMACAKTVKKVQYRHTAGDRAEVRGAGQVICLLHRTASQHGETGIAAAHHILVIAING